MLRKNLLAYLFPLCSLLFNLSLLLKLAFEAWLERTELRRKSLVQQHWSLFFLSYLFIFAKEQLIFVLDGCDSSGFLYLLYPWYFGFDFSCNVCLFCFLLFLTQIFLKMKNFFWKTLGKQFLFEYVYRRGHFNLEIIYTTWQSHINRIWK